MNTERAKPGINRFLQHPTILALITTTLAAFTGSAVLASPLQGTTWKLTAWSASSIDPASLTITANFAEGRMSGRSGVNSYSGPCKLGTGGSFSAGPFVSTQMGGPEPAMRAESIYLTLLGQAKSYRASASMFTLLDRAGHQSLRFTRSAN